MTGGGYGEIRIKRPRPYEENLEHVPMIGRHLHKHLDGQHGQHFTAVGILIPLQLLLVLIQASKLFNLSCTTPACLAKVEGSTD